MGEEGSEMAKKIPNGVRQNCSQIIVSGARVAFDSRTTEEVAQSIDPTNYKAQEKSLRKYRWELRQAEERAERDAV